MNYRLFHQILKAMGNDWRKCVGVDQHLYMMRLKANISHFCSNAMLSFNTIASALYLLTEYTMHSLYLVEYSNDILRQLPIKIKLSFEMDQSPIFELLFVILFVHVMSCTHCKLDFYSGKFYILHSQFYFPGLVILYSVPGHKEILAWLTFC